MRNHMRCDLTAQQGEPSILPLGNMSYKWKVREDSKGRSKRLDSNGGPSYTLWPAPGTHHTRVRRRRPGKTRALSNRTHSIDGFRSGASTTRKQTKNPKRQPRVLTITRARRHRLGIPRHCRIVRTPLMAFPLGASTAQKHQNASTDPNELCNAALQRAGIFPNKNEGRNKKPKQNPSPTTITTPQCPRNSG
jgi:hypothetical protein